MKVKLTFTILIFTGKFFYFQKLRNLYKIGLFGFVLLCSLLHKFNIKKNCFPHQLHKWPPAEKTFLGRTCKSPNTHFYILFIWRLNRQRGYHFMLYEAFFLSNKFISTKFIPRNLYSSIWFLKIESYFCFVESVSKRLMQNVLSELHYYIPCNWCWIKTVDAR